MLVMSLERTTPALRGELTRWLLEIRPNLFVGTVTARIRDKLWEKVEKAKRRKARTGAALQVWNTKNEQGFEIRSMGITTYIPIDLEGLTLILKPK